MSAEDQDPVSLFEDEGSHRRYIRVALSPGRKRKKIITLSLCCLLLRRSKFLFTSERFSSGPGDDTELGFCLFTPPAVSGLGLGVFHPFTHLCSKAETPVCRQWDETRGRGLGEKERRGLRAASAATADGKNPALTRRHQRREEGGGSACCSVESHVPGGWERPRGRSKPRWSLQGCSAG